MASATITTGTNRRYRSVEGTLEQVMDYLDENKIPDEKIIGMGYSGIADKLFFASFRLSEV